MPCLKINILWSMGNPILRINSNVQICLKIPPRVAPQPAAACDTFPNGARPLMPSTNGTKEPTGPGDPFPHGTLPKGFCGTTHVLSFRPAQLTGPL